MPARAALSGSLQQNPCKCLSDSGVKGRAAMCCVTLQKCTKSFSAAAQQGAAGRPLCTAHRPGWQALAILQVAGQAPRRWHCMLCSLTVTTRHAQGLATGWQPYVTPSPPSEVSSGRPSGTPSEMMRTMMRVMRMMMRAMRLMRRQPRPSSSPSLVPMFSPSASS